MPRAQIRFGADRLAAAFELLGDCRRVGLVCNDAARLAADAAMPARQALLDAGVPIVRLFAPEHGLAATAADGTAFGDSTDPLTGLPVVSLYGERFAPARDALRDLDTVLFDIPDVGARFYTYTWTLTHVIDACADAGVPVVVLERPNPLGGALESVEGPLLAAEYFSFVGRMALPIRHSLTLAEIARLWQQELRPDADVRVIECEGWTRAQLWPDTGLPFVATSPAIQSFESALLYPGLCVFEATNLSVGRGCELSFQAVGAPWLEAERLAERMQARALPGLAFHATHFTPTTGVQEGLACRAVRIEITEPASVRPVQAGLLLLAEVLALHRDFRWAGYPTAANPAGAQHFERIVGNASIRETLERLSGTLPTETVRAWTDAPGWAERWRGCVLEAAR